LKSHAGNDIKVESPGRVKMLAKQKYLEHFTRARLNVNGQALCHQR
jgi:hypothetical protein